MRRTLARLTLHALLLTALIAPLASTVWAAPVRHTAAPIPETLSFGGCVDPFGLT